jgi:hypothetical protein
MPSYRSVNVTKLTPGDTLLEPVFNERRTKLLRSGYPVDERLISRLAQLGITNVLVKNPAERTEEHLRKAIVPEVSMSRDSSCAVAHLVEHSCECGTIISIQPPIPDLPVATWLCKTCGAAYFGGCADSAKLRDVTLLAPDDCNPLISEGPGQPEPKGDSIQPKYTDGVDRRQQKRYSVALGVVAVPLGPDFSIAGPAARMIIRNISPSGAALAHTRFSDVPYFVLDFTAAGIELLQVVLKVLRVSNSGPIYEVAGKFISRVTYRRANRDNTAAHCDA